MAAKKIKELESENLEERNLDDNMKLLKNIRTQHIIDINMVRIFLALWLAASILVILPVFRESYSEVEKRNLAKFPKFSWASLAKGDYFDNVNLWFSDTFPLRDDFVSLNARFTNAFGINTVKVHGEIIEGDEIPDVVPSEDLVVDIDQPIPSVPQQPPKPPQPVVENFGAIVTFRDTGYEQYHFNQAAADTYCAAVNRASIILDGKAKVYSMIAPTSIDVTMPEKERKEVNSANQKKAIDYMYSRIVPTVSKINIYDTLVAHKDEYIYFRTDHHWTSLGAYYAYRDLMLAKGSIPAELSAFTEYKFEGFLGSFYTNTQSPNLKENPDYVLAYEPKQLKKIHTFTQNGESDLSIVSNGDALSATNKYLSFICGDKPLGIMTNPEITDGSACLVIKESYGNAMVAYLTQNYQNVYVVDYRHINQVYSGTLRQFVDERGIQDVVFVNNVSATRNQSLVDAINAFVGE